MAWHLQWSTLGQNSAARPVHLGGLTGHGPQVHWVIQGCGPSDQVGYFAVIVGSVCLPSEALSQPLLP